LLTIDACIVAASAGTYLRFAEAVNRLDISQEKESGARHEGVFPRPVADGEAAGNRMRPGRRSRRLGGQATS